jgi:hypothetical protein
MSKFLILYNSTAKASEIMANATPEEMKAGIDEWMKWKNVVSKTFNVDFGLPVQAVGMISGDGTTVDSSSLVNGYSIVEGGSKEELMEALKNHPQLKRPGSSIDVFEMLAMPGIEV